MTANDYTRVQLRRKNPWLVHGLPGGGDFVLFGFPYAGTGASSTYRNWPRRIGAGVLCPLQPPGRENRMNEQPLTTYGAYAQSVAAMLADHVDRPYGFVGHCGAVPYLLETTFELARLGLPLPTRLFASSWGAPHRGLYGPLNFIDLDHTDLTQEIQDASNARLGRSLEPELAELAAEILLFDLKMQRAYRYDRQSRIPSRTVVVCWTRDTVVPAQQVRDSGWDECADISYRLLEGDHYEFLRCPSALVDVLSAEMAQSTGSATHAEL
jgi:surfactin synthase thioesterase subunit